MYTTNEGDRRKADACFWTKGVSGNYEGLPSDLTPLHHAWICLSFRGVIYIEFVGVVNKF